MHPSYAYVLSDTPIYHVSIFFLDRKNQKAEILRNLRNPQLSSPSKMPRKKALLIGINYTGSKHQLNGCINDAMNVREYLIRERGFSPDPRDMVILTDKPQNRNTPFFPTGANMLAAFRWLVTGNNPGDSVWLSYSGHGSMLSSWLSLFSGDLVSVDVLTL